MEVLNGQEEEGKKKTTKKIEIERVQLGVRLEKKMVKVLKAVAEYLTSL